MNDVDDPVYRAVRVALTTWCNGVAMADESNKKNGPNDYIQAESILQLALAIPAGAFVGLGLGYWLDKHFHTGWIAIALMFLGATGGFVNLFRYLSRSAKRGGQ
jgi:F0F1-type ATP synthase assembly protein I